jgi:hypothetical protein
MDNLSNVWNSLVKVNSEVSDLYKQYRELKKDRLTKVLPGRRSIFFTATEFEFTWVLTNTGTDLFSIAPAKQAIIKPIVMSTDGVYCLTKFAYEAYLELSFTFTSGTVVRNRVRRTTFCQTPFGLANFMVINPNLLSVTAPCFDFEWKLEIGSNDRSYATDAILNNNQNSVGMLSRKCLGSYNNKQFEFAKPYYLDGNDFFTLTINPTLVPLSNFRLRAGLATIEGLTNLSAKVVLSMVTIGHKILGHGHRI